MKLSRREFIKNNAVAATAAAAGITIPGINTAMATSKDDIRWDKAPCRFCGTGCSVLVGTKNGRIVATHGYRQPDQSDGYPGDVQKRRQDAGTARGCEC